jgi:6-pyruvoyltetrahydropterin/6-carboxytetrahydropterin synthase
MWEIRKEIGFDYGHRVWSQKLNKEFSIDGECVCRHLHGHRGSVYFYLAGDHLDPQGMVTDFKHLNCV